MSARTAALVLFAALLAAAAPRAQEHGFAGLGAADAGFAEPAPGHRLSFPRDHGAHGDFRIEWWYLTANLQGDDGRDYGVQWTLFRSALAPRGTDDGWASRQAWMAHAAVTTPQAQHVAERLARGGIGQAGVEGAPFHAWIDDWTMAAHAGSEGVADLRITARGDDFGYALEAQADGPLVLQGEGGYSVKGPSGQASYYYSQPFYRVAGTLRLPGGEVAVRGRAWLDREWSSQPLGREQSGWDWFALHLDDGRQVMLARVRGVEPFVFGSLIAPGGEVEALDGGAVTLRPGRGSPPTAWRIDIPGAGLALRIEAVNAASFMPTAIPYWEGPVRIDGTVTGRGYLEMTGYPPR